MPRQVANFMGIQIMFCQDFNAPAHLHVHYGQKQGVMGVDHISTDALKSGGLPPKIAGLALEWLLKNRDEIKRNWDIHRSGGSNLSIIPPLVE